MAALRSIREEDRRRGENARPEDQPPDEVRPEQIQGIDPEGPIVRGEPEGETNDSKD